MNLKGKTALITGGGTGIGAAIAKRFIADGAKICITGRRKEVLDKFAQSLPSEMATTCPGDVSKLGDVERMVETTVKFGGKLDVLVNNAGIDPGGTVTDTDLGNLEKGYRHQSARLFFCHEDVHTAHDRKWRRVRHQYFFLGRIALPAWDACLLHVKSRPQHADQASRPGLRTVQCSLQRRLSRGRPEPKCWRRRSVRFQRFSQRM